MTTTSIPMDTSRYSVTGMTCDHCVNAINSELCALPGVHEVTVDLASGAVSVFHDQPLDPDQVAAAIHEAGYDLAS